MSWSGSDDPGGSGIASYTIYVSTDGGAFTPWLQGVTTLTTGEITPGLSGDTYAFYSVATDNVGNVQPTPTAAQATTTVQLQQPTSFSVIAGSGTYGGPATLTATLTASGVGIADEAVTFTFVDSATVTTVGSATTDANGVATLTGVSLASICAGTYAGYVGSTFAGDSNYAGTSGSGDLAVAQASLTVTVNPASKTYGGTDPAFSVSYAGS